MRERLQKLALLSAMGVTTLNVWTGSPLLALWLGSRVQGRGPPAMLPVFVVAASMAAISLVLLRVLGALGMRYDELTGRKPQTRRHTPWLRSMRGERPHEMGTERVGLSALDTVLVASVIIAVLAFEVWFFFFSSSPIDQRTGR